MGKRLRRLDIAGLKVGKLTVIEKVGYDVDKNGKRDELFIPAIPGYNGRRNKNQHHKEV